MKTMALDQTYLFFIFIMTGIIISILFDIFRILRRSFKTPDMVTYIQDILFWILAGSITLFAIFRFNNGEIRAYLFIGIGIGAILYLLTLSKYFIEINVSILLVLKEIIKKIIHLIFIPIKGVIHIIKKIFYKPIIFAFINFKRFFVENRKKIKNNPKKTIQNEKINI